MSVKQDIIYWLVRLPFLGVYDLSSLVGRPEREVAWTLVELEKLGWLESVRPASPYLEDDALHVISAAGTARLQEMNQRDLGSDFPVSRTDMIRRLASLEITDGINQFATELEDAVWRDRELEIEDLRSLPVAMSPELRWWPCGVEAYGCICHDGGSYAPFFIAWDRTAAPRFHRQRRVAGWYDFWDSAQPWGRDTIPSIIVLCTSETERDHWCDAVLASADRRQMPELRVTLALIDEFFKHDALGAIWHRPDRNTPLELTERLQWRWSIPEGVGVPRPSSPADGSRGVHRPTTSVRGSGRPTARELVALRPPRIGTGRHTTPCLLLSDGAWPQGPRRP